MRPLLGLCLLLAAARGSVLTLRLEPQWAGAPLAVPSAALAHGRGQTLRLTRLAGLLSEMTLRRRDGGVVRLDGQYGAFDAGAGRMAPDWAGVPDGDYMGIAFQIGLPAAIDRADPGRWPAGHPLNPMSTGLHWGWQGGYVFLALEGRWRRAGAADPEESGFSFHLATDSRRMPVRLQAPFRVEGATTLRLAWELDRLLAGPRWAEGDGSDSTHSRPGDAVAARLAAAAPRAIFWLEAMPSPAAAGPAPAARPAAAAAPPLAFSVPEGFPQPALPADNPLTAPGVALGRRLFFDPRLSGTARQNCASCHAPEHAFSDQVALSRGAEGRPGRRNAPPLFNLAWSPAYAWDGGKARIRDQALAAMTSPIEMHAAPGRVVAELGADPAEAAAFAAAFGPPGVTLERIGLALEQYLLTLVSADSKFDRARRGAAVLSAEEQRGLQLFVTEYDPARRQYGADCFHCHGGILFSDYSYKNNGLEAGAADAGRAEVTGRAEDAGKFKTPSLRNVAVTGPYMHDGRFATLEAVVAHYDHGVKRSAALDPNLAKHPPGGLALGAADQRALVAFLRTLTDPNFGR